MVDVKESLKTPALSQNEIDTDLEQVYETIDYLKHDNWGKVIERVRPYKTVYANNR